MNRCFHVILKILASSDDPLEGDESELDGFTGTGSFANGSCMQANDLTLITHETINTKIC